MAQAAWLTGRATSPDDRRIPRRWADHKTPEAVPLPGAESRLAIPLGPCRPRAFLGRRDPRPEIQSVCSSRPAAVRGGDKFRLLCKTSPILPGVSANKTGTMSGISTLAGYADTKSHGRVRFVIALKSNGPLRFQLLKAIEAGL